jgi:hypothetical protein
MKNNLGDILSFIRNEKDQEEFISYLDGRMVGRDREQFEKKLAGDPFLKDAMEGLAGMSSHEISRIRKDLNKSLLHRLSKKRRLKRIGPGLWIYAALILVLLLILAGYLVLSRLR